MKRISAVLAAGAIGVVGFGLAVPALADTGSTSSTPKPLTNAQKQSIEDFLADHPQLAQALAGRAADWQKLITAHPEIKTELAKLQALPADQRRAELKTWLAANPAAKQALQDYRDNLKEQRLTRQRDRIDKRLQRLNGQGGGNGGSPSSSPTGSSSSATGSSTSSA